MIVPRGQSKKVHELGLIKTVSSDGDLKLGEDVVEVTISSEKDEAKALKVPADKLLLIKTSDWKIYGATFGKVASKTQTILGYKLHLLITLRGVILDFELAPANVCDLEVGFELLIEHTDLDVLGDKAYISACLNP